MLQWLYDDSVPDGVQAVWLAWQSAPCVPMLLLVPMCCLAPVHSDMLPLGHELTPAMTTVLYTLLRPRQEQCQSM